MRHPLYARLAGVAVAALCIGGGAWAAGLGKSASAQTSSGAVMKVTAPPQIKKGDARIPIEISVDNAQNMASFQFILQYNADILAAADTTGGPIAQRGDFLGSSGREVVCEDPVSEPGAVRYLCVTLRPSPAGVDGSGKLATIYLKAIGSGKTDLTLDMVKSNHVDDSATEMPITAQNLPIDVAGSGGGMAWWLWVVIGLAAAVVLVAVAFGAMRMRSSRSGTPATAV